MGNYFNINLIFQYLPQLLSRLHITLLIVLSATAIGLIFGIILALFRVYNVPVLNQISIIYISFMRGTPILVQMFIVYYGLPMLLMKIGININRWDKLYFVIITYGLNAAAFKAEMIRAAIVNIPIGQVEAAYSVGMTKLQAFARIVAPQSVIIILPTLGITLVGLLQDTSLAFTLGIIDVMGKVNAIAANTYRSLEGYVSAAIIFFILSILLEQLFSGIEKKLHIQKI
ncbi:amino acid ABC transporter permease [Clostridium saccharoperbutylacetonicum]|uniref:L-cystine transport system permease protein TcyL n=1 Tax=Clostridium saccharoperbutylacetonicum N1-4(HMT) TaxID=931276 RepID=M1MFM2_9CLOT|nr:amino acid ABC transporter permease [Clostridium saccharoperbutylacetonicum]AGF55178.1 L-cystine transport system permease protein TcyL [Clostridium saccharoperbutylacetonicum N1-4(HMT)]AQR94068.1 L-cystine transport system permease protein TcyL [Clostridium saccharoperbutylacetonicum]NRT64111.1 L-cystine transport system permease protein [Clostridium saccharoperbutylacetonicum]NSB27478.1 L-cystine transport system permease protein [Clostridium saccharoperbutylacetonicum]NSB29767.1 L-cystin